CRSGSKHSGLDQRADPPARAHAEELSDVTTPVPVSVTSREVGSTLSLMAGEQGASAQDLNHDHPPTRADPPSTLKQAKDPVCGMTVAPATARWKHEHRGQTYFFCNPRCLAKFQAEPEKYASAPPGKGVAPAHLAAPPKPA